MIIRSWLTTARLIVTPPPGHAARATAYTLSGASCMDEGNTALRVNVVAGGGAGGTSSTFGAAFPGTGTAAGYHDGTNMQGARVFDLDSGGGTQYVLGVGLRKTGAGGSVEAGTATDPLRIDPTGTTTQPVSISGTVPVDVVDESTRLLGKASLIDLAGDSAMDEANNSLRVSIVSGAGAGGTSSTFGAAFPASGTAAGFSDGTNMQGARVFDADTGGGIEYVAGAILRKSAGGGSVEAGTATDPLRIDPTGATTQPVSIAGTVAVDVTDEAARVLGRVFLRNPGDTVNIGDVTNPVRTDPTGTTIQPVSGTVTANAGTGFPPVVTDGAAAGTTGIHVLGTDGTNAQILSTNTTGHVNIADGGNSITIDGTVTANAGSGTFTVGGTVTANAGTGFPPVVTDGAAAGTTGLHILGTDGTNAQILSTNATGHVNIADGGNSITIDGTVTSNAGTGFPPVVTDGAAAGTTGIHILGTDGTNAQILSTNTTGHVNIADGGNSITVDGTVTANAGTGPFLVAGVDAHDVPLTGPNSPVLIGARGSTAVPTAASTDGDSTRLWSSLRGALKVVMVDDDGDSIMENGAAMPALKVSGNVAHNATDGGGPVKIGGKARTTNPTAATDTNRVDATFDDLGRQVAVLNQVRDLVEQGAAITLSSTTETTIIASVASVFLDLTLLLITNSSATAVRVDFRDATTGTVRFSVAVAANGGAVVPFAVPWKQTAVTNNWTAQLSAAVTDIRIVAQAVRNV